jgi:hypothetical protein
MQFFADAGTSAYSRGQVAIEKGRRIEEYASS